MLQQESKNPDPQPALAACPVGRGSTPPGSPRPPPSCPSSATPGITFPDGVPPEARLEERKKPVAQPFLMVFPWGRENPAPPPASPLRPPRPALAASVPPRATLTTESSDTPPIDEDESATLSLSLPPLTIPTGAPDKDVDLNTILSHTAVSIYGHSWRHGAFAVFAQHTSAPFLYRGC